ncbi:MAG: hypothetical protein IKS48_08650 [Eubacterium sp.]|nr:hypothetical protein [Eubacterium sp.]
MAKKRNRQKELKLRKLLIVVWLLFIVLLGAFGFFIYTRKDTVKDDLTFSTRFSYQTNANPDINALIITYLSAMASSDQGILQSCVTEPAQFSDMTNIQSQSKIITRYGNINCYTVNGLDDNSTIVYAVSNITIFGIDSTPLDILGPYYVVKQGNQYLIDNGPKDQKVTNYMDKVNKNKDIQELYQMVKDDEEKKAQSDPALKDFLDRIGR